MQGVVTWPNSRVGRGPCCFHVFRMDCKCLVTPFNTEVSFRSHKEAAGAPGVPVPPPGQPRDHGCPGALEPQRWDGKFVLRAPGASGSYMVTACLGHPSSSYWEDKELGGKEEQQITPMLSSSWDPRSLDTKRGYSSFCLVTFRGHDACHDIQGGTKSGFGVSATPRLIADSSCPRA